MTNNTNKNKTKTQKSYNNVVAIAWITWLSLLTHTHGGSPLLVFLFGASK
jgi:hypothetical protein